MTKVTLNQTEQTPSQQIVARAKAEVVTTDAKGREIKLRKPTALNKLRFVDAMDESSGNPMWRGMVAPLMYVHSIDGDAVLMPSTKREIEALYQRLDEEGIEAIAAALPGNFGLANTEVDEEAAKK
ncbi:hypothetical protein KDW54_06720 [Burkholderia ambifaria]|uniref:hypothetical protein n=1 Tax=Burkholderia ambifaria TaxID=152480 RepID=UPI001B8DC3F0|nr:hypothetical protein [Burkholderia ambifaria]MBR8182091.1 hypothetical protein [Burkholderia ambifaria]